MQVITDAKELEKHTYIKTRNPAVFPKKERLGLAQRMMNEASDLVADLMEANDLLLTDPEERELRYRAQRSALRNCRKLIHHIELAHEILSGFSDDAFACWAKMAAGVKNQTAKWYKTDKERAAKLDAQKRHQ
ncbi:sugar ABC transporter ATP-binding protein [Flavonifractor plautii]|uniref:sugar ABC transporter ATP-binding protein n=1 Tax=Flavonifractor plautii TaxID=292800 RepID=UPI00232E8C36|nr:sugar ABC transporter ATP-binding protein [Flavonifractor plautii]MDB7893141.1 sugar ABC transporter ATP-binding protein [Flavonifractor plautii]